MVYLQLIIFQEGWTPLHVAIQSRNRDIAKILLVNGADKTVKNKVILLSIHQITHYYNYLNATWWKCAFQFILGFVCWPILYGLNFSILLGLYCCSPLELINKLFQLWSVEILSFLPFTLRKYFSFPVFTFNYKITTLFSICFLFSKFV